MLLLPPSFFTLYCLKFFYSLSGKIQINKHNDGKNGKLELHHKLHKAINFRGVLKLKSKNKNNFTFSIKKIITCVTNYII